MKLIRTVSFTPRRGAPVDVDLYEEDGKYWITNTDMCRCLELERATGRRMHHEKRANLDGEYRLAFMRGRNQRIAFFSLQGAWIVARRSKSLSAEDFLSWLHSIDPARPKDSAPTAQARGPLTRTAKRIIRWLRHG